MNRREYEEEYLQHENMRKNAKSDKNRLHFHLMPPSGWMNDPNGLCQFLGENHIYYQYTPFSTSWGLKIWGHYTTTDWIHYHEEAPFLFPDTEWDKDGAYSGSAFVQKDGIHFYYTGNVKKTDKKYDYIMDGREQNTMHVFSPDGRKITYKELIMTNDDYPANMSRHVRDPKVFEKNGNYYMIQGGRDEDSKACILIFQSANLKEWTWYDTIYPDKDFGYMWECPDLFEIDGQQFLVCCPQGVKREAYNFQNIYQCGYFPVKFDLQNRIYQFGEFAEFDKGFDIYAVQTFQDEKGRRILIGWMGIPDAEYDNDETISFDWIHALTMPRELCVVNGKILQKPLKEMEKLRINKRSCEIQRFKGWNPKDSCFEMRIEFTNQEELEIQLREDVFLVWDEGIFRLKMGKSGHGRNERIAEIEKLLNLTIFSDTSSVEIFINDGETVMTSRIYSEHLGQEVKFISGENKGMVTGYELGRFRIKTTE